MFASPPVGFSKPLIPITHGVIRWDSWYGTGGSNDTTALEASAQYPAWLFRAPLHVNSGTNPVTWGDTQATFDNEINVAANNGVDYFAYLRYGPISPELDRGYNYHMASSIKGRMKFCWMVQANRMGSTGSFSTQVAELVTVMQDSQYMKVLTNRPLVYMFVGTTDLANFWGGSDSNFAAMIASVRTNAASAGLGDPYFVDVGPGAYSSNAAITAWGMNAVSDYNTAPISALNQAYALLDQQTQAYWLAHFKADTMVPNTMVGWDPRPRKIQQNATITSWYQTPTLGEFTAHLQAARNFIRNNPAKCPAQTVLTYAWNEFTEGGVMPAPTFGDPSGTLARAFAAAKASVW